MAVTIETTPGLRFEPPEALFDGVTPEPGSWGVYDVAADNRFLIIDWTDPLSDVVHLQWVQNWFEELKARVPLN